MPRIPYINPKDITDPEVLKALETAERRGTPRPESQAIRAHNPAALKAFTFAWETIFHGGALDHAIKDLCRIYVSKSVNCQYCGAQRSLKALGEGMEESQYDDVLKFETSDRYDLRQKAALKYTAAILWDPEIADDALWEQLYRHFTIPEIVELGTFVATTLGQQRWIKTLQIGHGEFALTKEGLDRAKIQVW